MEKQRHEVRTKATSSNANAKTTDAATRTRDGVTKGEGQGTGRAFSHEQILSLQQTVGNRAVTQLYTDSVTRQLKAASSIAIQRAAEPDEEELQMKASPSLAIQRAAVPDEEELQMKAAPNHTIQLAGSQGGGGRMPAHVRAGMDSAFNADFSNVQIHPNSSQASDVGALAYAQGNDIHFAPGQYNPNNQQGLELLGHELTHVVQQREGRVKPTTEAAGLPVNDDPGLESEADTLGRNAARLTISGQ